jgi:hypothetical protein
MSARNLSRKFSKLQGRPALVRTGTIVDHATKSRVNYIAYLAIVDAGKNLPVLRELTAREMGFNFIALQLAVTTVTEECSLRASAQDRRTGS